MQAEAIVRRLLQALCCLAMLVGALVSRAQSAAPQFIGQGWASMWEGPVRVLVDETRLSEEGRVQLAFLRLVHSARDVDLCDKQAVIKHFGPWLGEMLDLLSLEARTQQQRQRLNELYEDSLGFRPSWADSVLNPEIRCAFRLEFGSVVHMEPRLRHFKPFDMGLAGHVFGLCATSAHRLPHGQISVGFSQCKPEAGGALFFVGSWNGQLSTISVALPKRH